MTQVKRNIIRLFALGFMLIVCAVTFWISQSDTAPIDKMIFKVDDLKGISEVQLASKESKITLRYKGNRWTVNDRFAADRHLIDLLFATLQQAEPKRPVAASWRDSVSSAMEKTGVKVSLISEGNVVKEFYAAGNAKKTQAYFKEVGNAIPYLINIPGYRVYAAGIFELDENGWRDKRVFNFNWKNFKSLEAIFPGDSKQNFTVEFMNRYFGITGLTPIDTMKLNNYLDAVSLLQVGQYGTGAALNYDSLLKTPPVLILEVEDVSARKYTLELYRALHADPNVVGRLDHNQAVLFYKQDLTAIMKMRGYFVKK